MGLKAATLASAIDVTVFQAHQSFEEYVARLQKTAIAPLLQAQEHEWTGENVMNKLAAPADILLLGRSGLGKSFHLEHYRRRCVEVSASAPGSTFPPASIRAISFFL